MSAAIVALNYTPGPAGPHSARQLTNAFNQVQPAGSHRGISLQLRLDGLELLENIVGIDGTRTVPEHDQEVGWCLCHHVFPNHTLCFGKLKAALATLIIKSRSFWKSCDVQAFHPAHLLLDELLPLLGAAKILFDRLNGICHRFQTRHLGFAGLVLPILGLLLCLALCLFRLSESGLAILALAPFHLLSFPLQGTPDVLESPHSLPFLGGRSANMEPPFPILRWHRESLLPCCNGVPWKADRQAGNQIHVLHVRVLAIEDSHQTLKGHKVTSTLLIAKEVSWAVLSKRKLSKTPCIPVHDAKQMCLIKWCACT